MRYIVQGVKDTMFTDRFDSFFSDQKKRLRASDWHWHFWSAENKFWPFLTRSLTRKRQQSGNETSDCFSQVLWSENGKQIGNFRPFQRKASIEHIAPTWQGTFTLSAKQLHWDTGKKTSNSDTNPSLKKHTHKKLNFKLQTGLRQIPPTWKKTEGWQTTGIQTSNRFKTFFAQKNKKKTDNKSFAHKNKAEGCQKTGNATWNGVEINSTHRKKAEG